MLCLSILNIRYCQHTLPDSPYGSGRRLSPLSEKVWPYSKFDCFQALTAFFAIAPTFTRHTNLGCWRINGRRRNWRHPSQSFRCWGLWVTSVSVAAGFSKYWVHPSLVFCSPYVIVSVQRLTSYFYQTGILTRFTTICSGFLNLWHVHYLHNRPKVSPYWSQKKIVVRPGFP